MISFPTNLACEAMGLQEILNLMIWSNIHLRVKVLLNF